MRIESFYKKGCQLFVGVRSVLWKKKAQNELFTGKELIDLTRFPKNQFFEYAPEYGERAWKVQGVRRTLIVWDEGNGWYSILTQPYRGVFDEFKPPFNRFRKKYKMKA